MAIDVHSEAEKIVRHFFGRHHQSTQRDVIGDITHLVTRAVAEAKSEQMEADCKAVCVSCREKWAVVPARVQADQSWGHECYEGMPDIPCKATAIRTAFAATETRDVVTCCVCKHCVPMAESLPSTPHPEAEPICRTCFDKDARQRFDKAAVELARRTKCIEPSESMVVNNSPDPGCECPACVLMIAARELGIDGDS